MFSFEDRNHLLLKLQVTKQIASDPFSRQFWEQYVWLDVSIILTALASLFFTWKYIYEVAVLYDELKVKYASSQTRAYKDQK